jgi:hypothetical protein
MTQVEEMNFKNNEGEEHWQKNHFLWESSKQMSNCREHLQSCFSGCSSFCSFCVRKLSGGRHVSEEKQGLKGNLQRALFPECLWFEKSLLSKAALIFSYYTNYLKTPMFSVK